MQIISCKHNENYFNVTSATFPAGMFAFNVQNRNPRNMHTGFLLCSNKSLRLFLHLRCAKCNIGCDTSTGLTAGQRPASIQPHRNTSMLQRDILPTFCAQKGHSYLSTVDHSYQKTATAMLTPPSLCANIL